MNVLTCSNAHDDDVRSSKVFRTRLFVMVSNSGEVISDENLQNTTNRYWIDKTRKNMFFFI